MMYVANDLKFIIAHWGTQILFYLWVIPVKKINIQIITNYVDGSDLHRMLFTEVQWAVVTHTKYMSVANMLTMYFPF